MTRYKLSNEAKTDLARIYWHGVARFGTPQADQYLDALIRRFDETYTFLAARMFWKVFNRRPHSAFDIPPAHTPPNA